MELDYDQLFALFVVKRKITLLRHLFSLPTKLFRFKIELFQKALDLEAYDIAALLHKEFFRLIRDIPHNQEELILTAIVSSFSKPSGMIEFKCYLCRQFTERFLQRHVRRLLDNLDHRTTSKSKSHILVAALNTVKSTCLLIETLDILAHHFQLSKVRCETLRQRLTLQTREYMAQVSSESEMKYLLLEKDFEHRDPLDLITKLQLVEFLESPVAENVVRDIWRSQYATQDSIFSASTNHQLTWHWWNFVRDIEADQEFLKLKDVR